MIPCMEVLKRLPSETLSRAEEGAHKGIWEFPVLGPPYRG